MRVALNVEQLCFRTPGGIGRYVERLLTLHRTRYPDDVMVAFSAWHRGARAVPGAVRLPLPRPLLYDAWHRMGVPRLEWSRALRNVDLVHTPMLAVPPRGSRPLVVTVHDVAFARFPEVHNRRGLRVHRDALRAAAHADRIICPSQAAADDLLALGPAGITTERVRVVPNGTDFTRPDDATIAAVTGRLGVAHEPYVLWTGTLEPRKHLDLLLDVWERAAPAGHRLVLTGVPGWEASALAGRVAALEEHGRVQRLGRVAEADLPALYAGARLVAVPSRYEGFGLPVLEAMAVGTPVVCSDVAALPEVGGDAVLALPVGDLEAWTAGIAGLLADDARRAAMTAAGVARAAAFTWDRTVERTHAVYAELV